LGATSVALSTNRNNKLRSGVQYVVFLAWPRETFPVALLDLPPGNADYSATLPASLKYQIPPTSVGKTDSAGRSTQAQASPGSPLEDFAQALQDLGTALNGAGPQEKASQQHTTTNVVAPRYQIGVQIMPINEEIARNLGQPELRGIGIVRVVESGRAERAGLRAGDVVTHVNQVPVPGVEDYQQAIRHREGGEPSSLTVFREGKLRYVDVP
jgi:S1-C subfamily serine protease